MVAIYGIVLYYNYCDVPSVAHLVILDTYETSCT